MVRIEDLNLVYGLEDLSIILYLSMEILVNEPGRLRSGIFILDEVILVKEDI